jgi:GNAT superfamily N-acetyltransferase
MNVIVRKGTKQDIVGALELIKELAAYEKAPMEVEVSVDEMTAWGFGEDKQFDFFIASYEEKIIGIAVYYFKYSTWKGKCLFLEDIVVTESYRRHKIGKKLFDEVVKVAKETKVRRMEWQVLEWNTPAIEFYKKYNAILDPEWLNGKLVYHQLQSF